MSTRSKVEIIDGATPSVTVTITKDAVGVPAGGTTGQILTKTSGTDYDTSWGAAGVGTGDLLSTNNLSDVTSAATSRTNLGLAIGTDVQAYDAVLDATTASFTTADETKLDGIEALADVSEVTLAGAETLTNKTITSFTNTVASDEQHVQVYNDSGVLLGAGTPVYMTGYNFIGTAAPTVAKADATSAATMPCIGITNETIGDSSFGEVVISGFLNSVNTSAFSNGDVLYVSETAGELTATPPVPDGTNQKQAVAVVLYAAGGGKLQVLTVGVEVAATTTEVGQVELATTAELDTGTDTIHAVTVDAIENSARSAKLDAIEAGADVTDTTNVTAAGALMDSEVDANLKTLVLPASTTISTFGASLVDDAAASNARTTLELVVGTDVAPAYVAPVVVSGTTDTLAAADHGVTNRYTNAAAVTVTLPTDASDDLTDGFWCLLVSEGAGGLTLDTTGLTLAGSSPNTTIAQNEALMVQKTAAANTWLVLGGTAA